MKLLDTFCLSLVASAAAAPLGLFLRQSGADGLTLAQIDALTPQFGIASGINPTGTGNCDGAVDGPDGKPIEVPCSCPPARDTFIQSLAANLAAGHAVNNPSVPISFPTDNSTASILARFNAATVTLQNLNGEGVGCPQASTTWTAQLAAIEAGTSNDTPAAPPATPPATTVEPPVSSTVPSTTAPVASPSITGADGLSLAQIDALTPPFGHDADVNPTGTGDCDGAVNDASGQPVKVPCSCPPPREQFIESLAGNLAAGFVVNNPSVGISFPTDNSTSSILARFNAATVTLQNLNGPGVGCPQASTTWTAQAEAISSGQSTGQVAVASPAPVSTSVSAEPASPSLITSAGGLSIDEINTLAPDLGFTAGVNPTGTGDCDGAVDGSNGQPIKVPCSCPPARDVFIQSLAADIAAGHAVNNPSVGVSFPTDDSTASQITRVQAALVALQNLNGPGQGCPAASTTLSAQLAALQA